MIIQEYGSENLDECVNQLFLRLSFQIFAGKFLQVLAHGEFTVKFSGNTMFELLLTEEKSILTLSGTRHILPQGLRDLVCTLAWVESSVPFSGTQ
jgi:hypothetical protein